MSKELYEVTIEYTKDYNGESWVATISDEKYIDMDTFERVKSDLETKLANNRKWLASNEGFLENQKLKQQLAEKEKEKEIECLRTRQFIDMTEKEMLELKIATQNQDKISFAVEKLSDVRSFISDATEIKEPDYTKVCNYIDNQIKQLKEGK